MTFYFEHTRTMFIEDILATCCYNISSTIALLFVWNLPFCLSILCKLICNVCCNIGWVLVWYWIMPGLFCNQIFDTLFLRFCWFLLDFYKLNTDIWYMLILLVRPHSNNWTVPSWNIWLIDSFLVTSFYFGMPFPHETICLIYAFLVC